MVNQQLLKLLLVLSLTQVIAACETTETGEDDTNIEQPADDSTGDGTDTDTGSGDDTNSDDGTDTDTGSDDNTNSDDGTDTDSGSDDDTNSEDGSDTDTGSEDDTNSDDGSDTGSDGNTDPSIQPNILFILTDDQGLDASAQYELSTDLPSTPTIDTLAAEGIVFDNMWATPACTTTRATILTGKYGHNSGVTYVPAKLSTDQEVIQSYLKDNSATENYESAVFGKWHVGGGNSNDDHPNSLGIEYYAGNLSNIDDYYDWELVVNGESEQSTTYHTTALTDLAIDWIDEQTTPWFAWVAYSAPHTPHHLPPESLHDRDLSGEDDDISDNRRDYFLASIEAMDTEIARLLESLDAETLENTVIIYLGDNGTQGNVLDKEIYGAGQAKGTLYQGGIAVPLVISGYGVERENEREDALVTATDLFATIAELAGAEDTQINDSTSFAQLLSNDDATTNDLVFSEYESDSVTGWTVRSDIYKIVVLEDGTEMFFSLSTDFSESEDLIDSSDNDVITEIDRLRDYGEDIVNEDTEEDNDSSTPLDITNAILTNGSGNCEDYVEQFTSSVMDVNNSTVFVGDLSISVDNNKCVFQTNAIPNHDFNDSDSNNGRGFPNDVAEQDDTFEITTSPTKADAVTYINLTIDNAILLNGVKVDLLSAGCYGVENGKTGCNDTDQPWRYDPMHEANGFNVDSHHAHAQSDGTYHYHGTPVALFDDSDDSKASPVIGFAADGFPIYGSYIDDNGTIRKAVPSYQLKSGDRAVIDGYEDYDPGGTYDGSFVDDYEYVEGLGDLDECNGMTVDGVYAYYVTDGYPYVIACFAGTPDDSFSKR